MRNPRRASLYIITENSPVPGAVLGGFQSQTGLISRGRPSQEPPKLERSETWSRHTLYRFNRRCATPSIIRASQSVAQASTGLSLNRKEQENDPREMCTCHGVHPHYINSPTSWLPTSAPRASIGYENHLPGTGNMFIM